MTQQIARIQDAKVAERLELPDNVKLTDAFHSGLNMVSCTAAVEIGWTWDGKNFAPPIAAVSTELMKRAQTNSGYVAAMRAGCSTTVGKNTIIVPLDPASLAAFTLLVARAALENDPKASYTVNDQTLGAGDFKAVAIAVSDFVQKTKADLDGAVA